MRHHLVMNDGFCIQPARPIRSLSRWRPTFALGLVRSVAPPVSKSLCCHMAWEFMRLPVSMSLPQWLRTVPNHQPLKFQKQEPHTKMWGNTSQNSPMLKKCITLGMQKFRSSQFPISVLAYSFHMSCLLSVYFSTICDRGKTNGEHTAKWCPAGWLYCNYGHKGYQSLKQPY
jgi:hypothetical protein